MLDEWFDDEYGMIMDEDPEDDEVYVRTWGRVGFLKKVSLSPAGKAGTFLELSNVTVCTS
jgi:hypothetical protein